MRKLSVVLSTGLFLFGLATCGTPGEPISETTAPRAWAATNKALSAGGVPGALTFSGNLSIGQSVDVDCTGGGNIKLTTRIDITTMTTTSVNVDYSVDYQGCMIDEITIDGTITYATDVQTSTSGSSVNASYNGNLTYSGALEGSCDIAVETSVTASTGGATVSATGTFCGYEANVIVTVSKSDYAWSPEA